MLSPTYRKRVDLVDNVLGKNYGIDVVRIHEKDRQTNVIWIRFIAWYILNTKFGLPSTAIGEAYDKDHSTILHGIDRVRTDLDWKQEADNLITSHFANAPLY